VDDGATSTSEFAQVSDGFPSHCCADVILSRDEGDEDEDRSLPVSLASGRDRKNHEVRTQLARESVALWAVKRVELWLVAPGLDGERSGSSR
jgi:hypothetical protein